MPKRYTRISSTDTESVAFADRNARVTGAEF
jgi:hypothetical protein